MLFRSADAHRRTEDYLRDSGSAFVILRNGWYLENHTESLAPALQYGAILGAAKEGKFASAARADYAAAAAIVLTSQGHENKVYELAGDASFTLSELAAEVSEVAKITVVYQDLPQEEYEKALLRFGLPMPIAAMLADSDAGAAKGNLDSQSGDLRFLIGRPTTPLLEAIRSAV